MNDDDRPSRLFPALVLLGLLAIALLGWLGFPAIQGWVAHQDCVASGRTNCG